MSTFELLGSPAAKNLRIAMSGAGVAAAREILLKCGQTHIIEKVDQGGNWSTLAKQVLKLNDNYPEGIKVGVSYIITAFPSVNLRFINESGIL